LAISGPLDKPVIAGPVRLSNTKLAGFDMGSKLELYQLLVGKLPLVPTPQFRMPA
jgi:AsmA protein